VRLEKVNQIETEGAFDVLEKSMTQKADAFPLPFLPCAMLCQSLEERERVAVELAEVDDSELAVALIDNWLRRALEQPMSKLGELRIPPEIGDEVLVPIC
jgi:hypothetical protein